jgi:hypothetical protein
LLFFILSTGLPPTSGAIPQTISVLDQKMKKCNSAPPELPVDYIYTSSYCEENVYLLCQEFLGRKDVREWWEIWVVFISNMTQTVCPTLL